MEPSPGAAPGGPTHPPGTVSQERAVLMLHVYNAARSGDEAALRRWLARGESPDQKGELGEPAMVAAAAQGHIGVLNALVEAGARLEAATPRGFTALLAAAEKGAEDVVALLLRSGADTAASSKDGFTALLLASTRGHQAIVTALLQVGVDVHTSNRSGSDALAKSAEKGHVGIVEELLRHRADVRATNASGITALHLAASNGHAKVMRTLIHAKGDVNSGNKDGTTALMFASRNNHLETVQLLLSEGVQVNQLNHAGQSATTFAAGYGGANAAMRAHQRRPAHPRITQALLDAGASPSTYGETQFADERSASQRHHFCDVCDRTCQNAEQLAQHMAGAKHKRQEHAKKRKQAQHQQEKHQQEKAQRQKPHSSDTARHVGATPATHSTPLHDLLTGQSLDNVTGELLQEHISSSPEAWFAPDSSGCRPLHVLCRNERLTQELLLLVLERLPVELWSVTARGGDTPVHKLMWNESLTAPMLALALDKSPSEVWTAVTRDWSTPVHSLLKTKSLDISLLSAIIGRVPDAVWTQGGKGGATPVHGMVWSPSLEPEMLELALNRLPTGVWLACDRHGATPIHSLLKNNSLLKGKPGGQRGARRAHVLALALEKAPATVWSTCDKHLATPMHILAINKSLDVLMLDLALSRVPGKIWSALDDQQCTPLHSLMGNRSLHAELLQMVLKRLPTTAFSQANGKGENPTHSLLGNESIAADMLDLALETLPPVVWKSSGSRGRTPVHVLFQNAAMDAQMMQLCFMRMPMGVWTVRSDAGDSPLACLHLGFPVDTAVEEFNRAPAEIWSLTNAGGTTLLDWLVANPKPPLGCEAVRQWARTYGTFLRRYRLNPGPDIHRSRSAQTHYAFDELCAAKVVLKWMKHRSEFEAEVENRYVAGVPISSTAVVKVVGWHTPAAEPLSDASGQTQELQSTDADSEYPYVLVMLQGERSLHDVQSKERMAGFDVPAIVSAMRSVAECVDIIHSAGLCHGDLKQRNILRMVNEDVATSWVLCDMDASCLFGSPVGAKTSSAYGPPELARKMFSDSTSVVVASESFDVWSWGVILFDLCAGRHLFAQDINNDDLIDPVDRTRLCVWDTISDAELDPVLTDADVTESTVLDAKNLIRWCLKGNSTERPNMQDILTHRFLNGGDGSVPRPLRMRYHKFLSHAQADASGTVGTLFFAFRALGIHCWLDMHQEVLTLEGMRQGVRDSRVFCLVLTKHVLASWFCQQEILTALEEDLPIQILLETEKRFNPFDLHAWNEQLGQPGPRTVNTAVGEAIEVPPSICAMLDSELPNAVTYRRRDFEADAMIRELCHRSGQVLSRNVFGSKHKRERADIAEIETTVPLRVMMICNHDTAGGMSSELRPALESGGNLVLTDDPSECPTADKVLLLLTHKILDEPSLGLLTRVIELDKEAQQDRITAVFSEEAGWYFGCEEQKTAPPAVQACLNEHEAIQFRAPDPGGPSRHEFGAMVEHLFEKLGSTAADTEATEPSTTIPVQGVRDALADAQREIAQLRQTHVKQVAELEALRACIVANNRQETAVTATVDEFEEGLPPAVADSRKQ